MRVVLPALDIQDDYISLRTAASCIDKKIYKMEPIVSGVYKRSIAESLDNNAKFAEFVGKIVQYDIVNMPEVEAYEKI
jgi:integral membrane protein 2B